MVRPVFSALPSSKININVTGGEPLLVPHLLPLLEQLRAFENLGDVNIITNGTVSSEKVLQNILYHCAPLHFH